MPTEISEFQESLYLEKMEERDGRRYTFPTHDLPDESQQISVRKLSHTNPYDFTKKHRHTYFELLFFKQGGGEQLIDFEAFEIKDNACYIVLPNQIHLLKRRPSSTGFVVQFYSEEIMSNSLMSCFSVLGWQKKTSVLFENNADAYQVNKQIFELMSQDKEMSVFEMSQRRHLLHASLFSLFNMQEDRYRNERNGSQIGRFLSCLEEKFTSEHQVNFYAEEIGIRAKQLSALTNKHIGMTPLKVIHARLLLEAKRILLFGEHSQKEIAYYLGFDSPSSFNNFIKSKTGLTPLKLQSDLVGIHN